MNHAISRIAFVRCGRTLGSESISRHDIGPFRRYESRNIETAWLPWPPEVISCILNTVAGDKIPCAAGKEGSVSQLANTDCDSFVFILLSCSGPNVFSICWAVLDSFPGLVGVPRVSLDLRLFEGIGPAVYPDVWLNLIAIISNTRCSLCLNLVIILLFLLFPW